MINSNVLSVVVRNVNSTKNGGVYFSRVVDHVGPDFDANVILSALRMLFPSDSFKITLETYGA